MTPQTLRTAFRIAPLALAIALLLPAEARSQTSPVRRISYQGVLRGSTGSPYTGSVNAVFRFWSAPSGGTTLWEESYTAGVPPQLGVANGLFTASLGDVTHRTAGAYTNFEDVFRLASPSGSG